MRATTAIALFAAVSATVAALPAQAQMPRAAVQLRIQPQLQTGRGACARSFADTGCATYQNRLVQASPPLRPSRCHGVRSPTASSTRCSPASTESCGRYRFANRRPL